MVEKQNFQRQKKSALHVQISGGSFVMWCQVKYANRYGTYKTKKQYQLLNDTYYDSHNLIFKGVL
jgi:hypothetical protein